ncbi:lytic transglycosylase domain-containing protein [Georhizobium profundi]|jgi:soluble lytic murein transglycosylase-like protein|uniref:Lytic transglycosylase domain-containing protein n=1 Tax=Georhizobium profundi TaxID=2341112 RepID=A0A3Q8XNI3_9HYPH|nr:lytic transglycosylase domain-containing protein [Georhizobium profundi]
MLQCTTDIAACEPCGACTWLCGTSITTIQPQPLSNKGFPAPLACSSTSHQMRLAARMLIILLCGSALTACATSGQETAGRQSTKQTAAVAPQSDLDRLIASHASAYGVPESLIRRVVARESNYNPAARNGPNLGLMQIRHDTARTMGYRGEPAGLLDADTNLRYAVKYLRGAYIVADRNEDRAIALYQRGYYYDAKRRGLLVETGLRAS